MLFGYARVSTTTQNLDRQIHQLRAHGVEEEHIYTDKISGAKSSRPQLDELKRTLRPGDKVVVESLSRLSRSSKDLLEILSEWDEKGVEFISLKENLNFHTQTGKLILGMLSAIIEFERDMIRQRVFEGLEAAKRRGHVGGRPPVDKHKLAQAIKLYKTKEHTLREIEEFTGVSTSTLYRALQSEKEKATYED